MTCKFVWVCYAMMLSLAAEGKHHPPPHSAALESSTIIIPTYDCKNTVQERKQKNGEVCQAIYPNLEHYRGSYYWKMHNKNEGHEHKFGLIF